MISIVQCLTMLIMAEVSYAASVNSRDVPNGEISDFYLMGLQNVTWLEAYVMCKEVGMELLTITSEQDQERVNEFIASKNYTASGYREGFWIGAVRLGACGPDFMWLTSRKPVVYRNFATGQPDNGGKVENCLHIYIGASGFISWNDNRCQENLKFICQAAMSPELH